MSVTLLPALALLLAAAALHAGWNLVLRGSGSRLAMVLAATAVGGLLLTPAWLAPGPSPPMPLVLLSSGAELVYMAALVGAYARLDFAVAYPSARGSATLFAAGGAVVLLGERLTPFAALGLGGVVAGLVLISSVPRTAARIDAVGGGLALLAGIAIATYTLTDKVLVHQLGALRTGGIVLPVAGTLGCAFLVARGRRDELVALLRPPLLRPFLLVAAGVVGAYGLVLLALQIAPAIYVAPVREISVVFGALAARRWLGDPHPGRRAAGAAAIAVGVLVLTLSG